MSSNCKSCGRIMTKPEDFSGGDLDSLYCSSCTNADGSLKNIDEITLHIANQLIMSQGIDREAATKAARSILSVQPQWKTILSRKEKGSEFKTRLLIITLSSLLILSTITTTLLVVKINRQIIFSFTRERVDYYRFTGDNKLQKTRIVKSGDQFIPHMDFGRYLIASYNDKPNEMMYAEIFDIESQKIGYVSVFRYPTAKQIRQIITPRNVEYKNFFVIVDNNNQVKLISINDNKEKIVALPINEKDVVCVGNLVIWIESNKFYPQYNTVMSLNVADGKISPIDDSATEKKCIKSYGNKVFWTNINTKTNTTTINGYDIQTNMFVKTGIEVKNSYFDSIVEGCGVALENKNWFVFQDKIAYIEREDFSALANNLDDRAVYRLHVYNYIDNNEHEIAINNYTELNNSFFFVASENQLVTHNSSIFGEYIAYISDDKNMQGITIIDLNHIDAKPTFIKTKNNATVIAIYDNWLFYTDKKEHFGQERFVLIAENLTTKAKIEIGDYIQKDNHHFDFNYRNGFITWSAWTEDSGYDIFYTRLP